MNFFKKILLAIIIIIFSVVLFYLYKRRLEMMDSFNEGFMTPNNILALNTTVNTLPLHQYCIKASYNTALDRDNTISLDMLDKVLTRGCRFIDFEVYFVNRLPVVAYSTDASYTSITTSNYVPLKIILDRAIVTAFTSSPTKADPLFIQLRIKAMDHNVYVTLYREVAKVLDSLFPSNSQISRFYKNNASGSAVIVDRNTLLKDIMGRVIIVADIFTNDQYDADTTCNSVNTAAINKYNDETSQMKVKEGFTTQILDDEINNFLSQFPNGPIIEYLKQQQEDNNIRQIMNRNIEGIMYALENRKFNANAMFLYTFYTKSETDSKKFLKYLKDRLGSFLSFPPQQQDEIFDSLIRSVFNLILPTDNTTSPTQMTTGNDSSSILSCYDLKRYVNMNNGNEFLRTNDYTTVLGECNNPPYIMNDNVSTNVTSMRFVSPGPNISVPNPTIREFIVNHGCQIIAYQYYHDDSGLEDCEQFFSDNKFAFVPMSKALRYFNKKAEEENI